MATLSDTSHALKALADPTRLRLLELLTHEELSVAELTRILSTGQSTVSQHLAQLRDAGLIVDRKDGTKSFYSRAPGSGAAAQAWSEMEDLIATTPEAKADRAALAGVLADRA